MTDKLSDRELVAVWLYSKGLGHEQVGRTFHLSHSRARDVAQGIYRKLGAHSRHEAVAKALRRGLIP